MLPLGQLFRGLGGDTLQLGRPGKPPPFLPHSTPHKSRTLEPTEEVVTMAARSCRFRQRKGTDWKEDTVEPTPGAEGGERA